MKNHVPIESLDSEIPVPSILCLSELSFDAQFISTPKTDAGQFLDNTVDQACTQVSDFMIPTNRGNISKTMTYRIAPSQPGCGAVTRGPEHFWAQKHCCVSGATVHVVSRSELWLGSGFCRFGVLREAVVQYSEWEYEFLKKVTWWNSKLQGRHGRSSHSALRPPVNGSEGIPWAVQEDGRLPGPEVAEPCWGRACLTWWGLGIEVGQEGASSGALMGRMARIRLRGDLREVTCGFAGLM